MRRKFEKVLWHQYDPVLFDGFYNSVFDITDYDVTVEDWSAYQKEVARRWVQLVESALQETYDFIAEVKLREVWSPAEYNFMTDRFNADVLMDTWDAFRYAWNHQKEFEAYLKKRFTPRSGFIPFPRNTFWGLVAQKSYFWSVFLDWLATRTEYFGMDAYTQECRLADAAEIASSCISQFAEELDTAF